MVKDQLIMDLDFIMTHPKVGIDNLEWFYNNCLMSYPSVPLFKIVNHMQQRSPSLLRDWSSKNVTIREAMKDLGFSTLSILTIDLSSKDLMLKDGFYIAPYQTNGDLSSLSLLKNYHRIHVTCDGNPMVIKGVEEKNARNFILYLKKWEGSK
ncbi:hypothetical protein ABE82_26955 (plasmid) [Paenibacillus peoriae]|uniref:hypothetical protein n=1 Tax=Paenibacillus peoriae TaxID=59893 RepID=UPI0007209CD9|nr:hypothetical protein [Paenibacillus peoriae]ALS10045.1 hypothetical protein ABE82_26955 [Paenibacillus peoriae]